MRHKSLLITGIVVSILISHLSCNLTSKKVTEKFDNSIITAEMTNGKFNGVVEQVFTSKDDPLKSVYTTWENGLIKDIFLYENSGIKREMKFEKNIDKEKGSVGMTYRDVNDKSFTHIPVLNKEYIEFCEKHAFLSATQLEKLDTTIFIFNVPSNAFITECSLWGPDYNYDNNSFHLTEHPIDADTFFISLDYLGTDRKITLNINIKNAR